MKKVNMKLAAALFAAIGSFLVCSCGNKIQTPQKIELVRPEKPTDAKYFVTKLNKDNSVSITGIKMLDMINDDVYENILVPATIEGLPVSTVSIYIGGGNGTIGYSEEEITNKKVQKKALHQESVGYYLLPQRLEFEEGIKTVVLDVGGAYIINNGDSSGRHVSYFSSSGEKHLFDGYYYENRHKLEQTFGLREIVFPDSVQFIVGNFSGLALEKVKFPANIKRLDCNIPGLYYNNPEVVYPATKFVVNGFLFDYIEADEFVIPDAISDIRLNNDNIVSVDTRDYWHSKIKKLVLPKKLNVSYDFKRDGLLNGDMSYFYAEEIVVPDNATLTTRTPTPDYNGNYLWRWQMSSSSLKKFTLGKNATMDIFNFRKATGLTEFDIGEGAKINFAYAKKAGWGPNYFKGCKLSLSSQQKLKEIGYEGEF